MGNSARTRSSSGCSAALAALCGSGRGAVAMGSAGGLGGTGCLARSVAARIAARLGLTPTPLRSTTASKSATGKGSAPLPARAPKRLAEITLPCAAASACMSSITSWRQAPRTTSSTAPLSATPLPGTIFSCTA